MLDFGKSHKYLPVSVSRAWASTAEASTILFPIISTERILSTGILERYPSPAKNPIERARSKIELRNKILRLLILNSTSRGELRMLFLFTFFRLLNKFPSAHVSLQNFRNFYAIIRLL